MADGLITRPGIDNDPNSFDPTNRTLEVLLAPYGELSKNVDGIQSVNRLVYADDMTAGDAFFVNGSGEAAKFLTGGDRIDFAGFVQETLATGQTGRVAYPGFVSRVHSGLTIGEKYYLDGSVQLSLTSSPFIVGRAISATELVVINPLVTGDGGVVSVGPTAWVIVELQASTTIPIDEPLNIDSATAGFTTMPKTGLGSLAAYASADAMASDPLLKVFIDGRIVEFTGTADSWMTMTKESDTTISFDHEIPALSIIRVEIPSYV
jgi:hypothetical protein